MALVLYSGPSLLDRNTDIEVLLTTKSQNVKTGNMAQTWILLKNKHPLDATKDNSDSAICGNCIHRQSPRTCYVNVGQGPSAVYKGARQKPSGPIGDLVAGRMVRLGAYGDPAAAPTRIWEQLLKKADGWTGYTHQWGSCDQALKKYCMASVESVTEMAEARLMGWRTYRVTASEERSTQPKEIICPTETTDIQCVTCGYCNGGKRQGSVNITVHGPQFVINRFNQEKAA